MSDNDQPSPALDKYAKKIEEREELLYTEEERRARQARVRAKYYLIRKWQKALDDYEGPGEAELLDDYRPSGILAPVDVPEIAGLLVDDQRGYVHKFRLYRDKTIRFIRRFDPDETVWTDIDPMTISGQSDRVYESDGLPTAVAGVIEAMPVDPRWEDYCDNHVLDGRFVVETYAEGHLWECEKCGAGRSVLSWLGDTVPEAISPMEARADELESKTMLSERESQVIARKEIPSGWKREAIADDLGIEVSSVDEYIQRAREKYKKAVGTVRELKSHFCEDELWHCDECGKYPPHPKTGGGPNTELKITCPHCGAIDYQDGPELPNVV